MQQGEGSVQIGAFRDYTSQHGTVTLAPSDVEQIFRNIDGGNNNMVQAPANHCWPAASCFVQLDGQLCHCCDR